MAQQQHDTQLTIDEVFEHMVQSFHPEVAGTMEVTYQFDLKGDTGGKWWVQVADGKAMLSKGEVESPTVVFVANVPDYIKIAQGQLDGMTAFLQGKLAIKGDVGVATLLPRLFEPRD